MKICPSCSTTNNDDVNFCTQCGTPLSNPQQQTHQPQSPAYQPQSQQPYQSQPPVYQNTNYSQPYQPGFNQLNIPSQYEPVTVGQYILYNILFSIPIIGFVILLMTAFGSNKKISLKNYARSFLVIMVIVFIVAILFSVLGVSLMDGLYY